MPDAAKQAQAHDFAVELCALPPDLYRAIGKLLYLDIGVGIREQSVARGQGDKAIGKLCYLDIRWKNSSTICGTRKSGADVAIVEY